MKVSVCSSLVVGAALLQASAEPLRVITVDQPNEVPTLRFGHAVAHANPNDADAFVARIAKPNNLPVELTPVPTVVHGKGKGKGRGYRACKAMKEKAQVFSDYIRHTLGWETDATNVGTGAVGHEEGFVRILPFMGTPPQYVKVDNPTIISNPDVMVVRVRVSEGGQSVGNEWEHGYLARIWKRPFVVRLHHSLMTLGKWEGRAVAFVLGCGIGVLLRMFWVLAIITYRSIKGTNNSNEYEYDYIVFEHVGDAEELVVPPPNYSLDEKASIPVEESN